MDQQFSPGLLYAVAPEDLRELHLQDESATVEWEESESTINALTHAVCDFFHKTAK
ncbi:MAG: hypothetical protein WCK93_08360 [Nitrosomonadales bacterium]|jgi:hypothetical protein